MIALLDTNIVLDVLLQRGEFEDAYEVLGLAEHDVAIELVTASSVTDIFYMLTSNRTPGRMPSLDAQSKISDLVQIVDIAPVTKKEILEALDLQWEDFEDAVQYVVAQANGADCIITHNKRDFAASDLDVWGPAEFLERMAPATPSANSQNSDDKSPAQ